MRAYSLFEVKSFSDEKRIITGIATTPNPDRVGDIVEPKGMHISGPVNLFLYHNQNLPVGTVKFKNPTSKGVEFEAHIPTVEEEGTVKTRVDEAWHSVKYGLLKAVSIGFRPINKDYEILGDGSMRFKSWEMLELSLVGVPANPDALIHAFKSCNSNEIRNLIGDQRADKERELFLSKEIGKSIKLSKPSYVSLTTKGAVKLART